MRTEAAYGSHPNAATGKEIAPYPQQLGDFFTASA
jgi:hypothetical protein